MKYILVVLAACMVGGVAYLSYSASMDNELASSSFTEIEEGFDDAPPLNTAELNEYRIGRGVGYTLTELQERQRPPGPLRVGVQVGHLDNESVPEELEGLTRNGAGATFGQYNERDTVAVIAQLVARELEQAGVVVDILPATVPPGYVADAFVSIHADGNPNQSVRGFKMAGPRRDYSGRSEQLVAALYDSYAQATNLPVDSSISRRMTAYYAFNWPRYEHAVHPYTPAVIVETGFLTNAADRAFLLNRPADAAAGIAGGVLAFLNNLPPPNPLPQSLLAPQFPLTGTISCAEVRAERRNRDDTTECVPAIVSDDVAYLLAAASTLATSSFPFTASVTGEYQPIQMLDNYFWFQYEVAGIISNAVVEPLE